MVQVAAQSLMDVTDVFLEENNPIVSVAKKMSKQMSQMAQYARGRGELQTKTEMINTAKAIAANGQGIVRFANLLSEQCTDEKIKTDLQDYAEMIPTLSTQLSIIASVKASTPDDTSVSQKLNTIILLTLFTHFFTIFVGIIRARIKETCNALCNITLVMLHCRSDIGIVFALCFAIG